MQLGSPNVAEKCSTMSSESPFYFWVKRSKVKARVTKTLPVWIFALCECRLLLVASVVIVVAITVVVTRFPGDHGTAVSRRRVMHRHFQQLLSRRHLVAALDAVAVFHVVAQLLALLQVHGVVVLEVRYAAEIGVLHTDTGTICFNCMQA